jgi:hypothetical protein
VASAAALLAAGCDRGPAPPGPRGAATAAAPDATDAWRFAAEKSGAGVRVTVAAPGAAERVLVRVLPAGPVPSASELAARERDLARRWKAAVAPAEAGAFEDLRAEHEAWLETAARLEDLHVEDAAHLGVMRDLLAAYLHVLSFETEPSRTANVCLLASRLATRLEAAADPPEAGDRRLAEQARTRLLMAMKLYPCAAERLAWPESADVAPALRAHLRAVGQSGFVELERFPVGRMSVRAFRTASAPPDAGLLWEEKYFVVSGAGRAVPENTVAFVLARQGEAADRRYYLFFRSMNLSRLVALYGPAAPDYGDLRRSVELQVREALKAPNAGS